MKKFIIFFLMVFLYLGNSQARTETKLVETIVGDVSSVALDGINAIQASEYIIKEHNCSTGEVTLSVGNAQPGVTYYWFTNPALDSIDILNKGLNYTVNANGAHYLGYWPTGTASGLNPATLLANTDVMMYIPFTPQIVSTTVGAENPYNLGVEGSSTVSFSVEIPEYPTPATSEFTYQWYLNGVAVGNTETTRGDSTHYTFPLHMAAGTYNVTVIATQAATGCARTSASWQVNVSPSIAVTIDGPSAACQGDRVTLNAQIDGSSIEYAYQWLVNGQYLDGEIEQNLTFLADSFPGTNYFSVKITRDGCEYTVSSELAFTLEENYIEIDPIIHRCPDVYAELTANYFSTMGNDPYRWAWFKINGVDTISIDTTYVNTLLVDSSGLYYVEPIFRGAICGIVSDTINIDLDQYSAIHAVRVISSQDSVCNGGQVAITAWLVDTIAGDYIDTTLRYIWYKDGLLMPDAHMATIWESYMAVDDDTTYHRYMAYVSIDDCDVAVYMDSVRVVRNPVVTINGTHDYCVATSGPNVELVAWVDGVARLQGNFAWYVNGQLRAHQTDYIYREEWQPSTDPYTIVVEYQNSYGCSAFSEPYTFYVHEAPVVTITTPEDTICTPVDGLVIPKVLLTANLNDYNETSYTYQWYRDTINTAENLIEGATQSTYLAPITAGENNYYVSVRQTTSDCRGNARIMVYGANPPVIDSITVLENIDTICEGRQITFQAHISGGVSGGEIYTWYKNGVEIPGATQNIYTEYPQTNGYDISTYIYNVAVTQNAIACASIIETSKNIEIVVKPNPTVVIEGDGIVCSEHPNNINLIANVVPTTPAFGSYKYQWFEENRAITGIADTNDLVISKSYRDYPYNFHVVVYNDYGCTVESTVFPVLVNAAAIVNITSTETLVCEGGEVTMTANLNNYNMDMLTYQWYKDSISATSLIAGATRSTYTTVVDTTTTFFVRVEQLNSLCVTPDFITIQTVEIPVIDTITLSVYEICEGQQVKVTAAIDPYNSGVPGSPYSFTWFRNGVLIEGVTGSEFVDAPFTNDEDNTSFVYSAYVTQLAAGCTSLEVAAEQLNVYRNPRPVIAGDQHVCETDSVFLIAHVDTTSRPVGTLSYTWYESGRVRDNMAYGYGNSQYFAEYLHANENPYRFTVEVTRENGCTAISEEVLVYVYKEPVVNITSTETEICVGGEVTMTANLDDYNPTLVGTSNYITYQWYTTKDSTVSIDWGNGIIQERTYTIETIIPGATEREYRAANIDTTVTYGVRVEHTLSHCFDIDEITITVNPVPVIDSVYFTDNQELDTVCEGRRVEIAARIADNTGVGNAGVYTWYRNNQLIEGVTQATLIDFPMAIDNEPTLYVYNVYVSQDASGCTSLMDTFNLSVLVYPNPTVEIAGDPIVCVEEKHNIQLSANVYPDAVNGSYTYTWLENNVPFNFGINDSTANDSSKVFITKEYRDHPYSFSVEVTNEYGCSVRSESFIVYVNDAPVVAATVSEDTICEGGQITLNAHLANWNADQLEYRWYHIEPNSANVNLIDDATLVNYTTTLTDIGVHKFFFSAYQRTSSCIGYTDTLYVTVREIPEVRISTVINPVVCDGGQTTLTAEVTNLTPSMGNPIYTWYKNGNVIEGAYTNTITESLMAVDQDTTKYKFSVKVQFDASGCISEMSNDTTVTVLPTPTVTISANSSMTYCENGQVTLYANVNPAETSVGYTYQWYLDNVLIQGEERDSTISRLPARETPYYYHVVVKSEPGCETSSMLAEINVVAQPVVDVTVDQRTICEGGIATFTATVDGGIDNVNGLGRYQYLWFNNVNGYADTLGREATYTVPTTLVPGNYIYFVEVSSIYGCKETTYYNNFRVVADPVVEIEVAPFKDTIVCDGGSTTLAAIVTGGFGENSYQWYLNGLPIPGATDQTYETRELYYAQTNVFTVEVIQTGVGCQHISEPFIVPVRPALDVVITGNLNTCEGGSVVLNAAVTPNDIPGNILSYQWYRNGTEIHGANSSTYTTEALTLAGNNEYHVVVTGTVSGCSIATSGSVQANVVPDPVVSITGAHSVCSNEALTLSAFVENGINPDGAYIYVWTWSTTSGSLGSVETAVPSFTLPTLAPNESTRPYYVQVSIYRADNSGCNATSVPFRVDVLPVPTVNITFTDGISTVCEGGSIELTANVTPSGNYNYTWKIDGVDVYQNQRIITRNNMRAGTYNYEVTVVPAGSITSCSAVATAVAVVVADPVILPGAITANYTEMCVGGDLELSLDENLIDLDSRIVAEEYSYQWGRNGFDLTGAIQNQFSVALTDAGTYTYSLRVTMNNPRLGCASAWGYSDVITVVPQPIVHIVRSDDTSNLDVCAGGSIMMTATVMNDNSIYGTPTYQWQLAGMNVTGATRQTYSPALTIIGHNYLYTAAVDFTGYNCGVSTSNQISVNVVNKPTWTDIDILPNGHLCLGEKIDLNATLQGGVQDPVQNTNGIVQWYVTHDGITREVVGGLGGSTYDVPTEAGSYDYFVSLKKQIGSGCTLADHHIQNSSIGGASIIVHELPNATFSSDDVSVCGNQPLTSSLELEVNLTGEYPIYFDIQNTTNGVIHNFGPVFTSPYPVYLPYPSISSEYQIINVRSQRPDRQFCYSEMEVTDIIRIHVMDVVLAGGAESFSTGCQEVDPAGYFVEFISVDITSYDPNNFPTTYDVAVVGHPELNITSGAIIDGMIEVHLPVHPGEYQLEITIAGCAYYISGVVVAGGGNADGSTSLIEQRWDDVLVVNNNIETNGGYHFHSFQWYRDGSIIEGATGQYYCEDGGLKGTYSVALNGYYIHSTGDTIYMSFISCDFVPNMLFDLKVYPTPALIGQAITIEIDLTAEELKGAVLDIYDARGAHIRSISNITPVTRIDGFMTQGAYFGRIVTSANEIKAVKFVIVK